LIQRSRNPQRLIERKPRRKGEESRFYLARECEANSSLLRSPLRRKFEESMTDKQP